MRFRLESEEAGQKIINVRIPEIDRSNQLSRNCVSLLGDGVRARQRSVEISAGSVVVAVEMGAHAGQVKGTRQHRVRLAQTSCSSRCQGLSLRSLALMEGDLALSQVSDWRIYLL